METHTWNAITDVSNVSIILKQQELRAADM